MRECGLKFLWAYKIPYQRWVTPCAGVWIEIDGTARKLSDVMVTPCAGVWIEIVWIMEMADGY